MPFTPDFDQPNNTEIQEYKDRRTKKERDAKVDVIVAELDYQMAYHSFYTTTSVVGYLLDNDKEVCDCIRAIYIGIGWSDVIFKQTMGYTTVITLVK